MEKNYRLLICGSSRLPEEWANFTKELGKKVIESTNFTLLTGGLKSVEKGVPTVDWSVVEGALEILNKTGVDTAQRIITLLPHTDWEKAKRFKYGNVVIVRQSNLRSRRFFMVHNSDAVITISGADATKEIIDLAWVLKKPLLPLPFTGGSSEDRWNKYRDEFITQFNLNEDELSVLENGRLYIADLADLSIKIIQRSLKPKCFVAMKFNDHPFIDAYEGIKEVAEQKGYIVNRADQEIFSGSIVQTIWDLIRASDIVIIDITGFTPNVFYELGIAHAFGKKTLILIYNQHGKVPDDIPFDIKVERILAYGNSDTLKQQLLLHL